MKMYHPKATEPVEVHESQIETMKNRGWSLEPPRQPEIEEEQDGEP